MAGFSRPHHGWGAGLGSRVSQESAGDDASGPNWERDGNVWGQLHHAVQGQAPKHPPSPPKKWDFSISFSKAPGKS